MHWGYFSKAQDIEAGVKLIKRISESIENPTPAKIGTLWNGMMKDSVSDVSLSRYLEHSLNYNNFFNRGFSLRDSGVYS